MATLYELGLTNDAGADSFIKEELITTGDVRWVDSVNGNDSNDGKEATPFATLAAALSDSSSNNGDIVIIKSGHVETLAAPIVVAEDGICIFGLGSGTNAPTFTVNAAVVGISVEADNIIINNLRFPEGTTTPNTARMDLTKEGAMIQNCTFLCGVNDQNSLRLAVAAATSCTIDSCTFSVEADGPDSAILISNASVSGIRIENCSFDGKTFNWDDAAIFSAVAHLRFIYENITLTGNAAIEHTAAAKGSTSNIIAGDGSSVTI